MSKAIYRKKSENGKILFERILKSEEDFIESCKKEICVNSIPRFYYRFFDSNKYIEFLKSNPSDEEKIAYNKKELKIFVNSSAYCTDIVSTPSDEFEGIVKVSYKFNDLYRYPRNVVVSSITTKENIFSKPVKHNIISLVNDFEFFVDTKEESYLCSSIVFEKVIENETIVRG